MTDRFERELETFLCENFECDNDGFVRHIRSGQFNGNGLLEPVTFTNIEKAITFGRQFGQREMLESAAVKDLFIIVTILNSNGGLGLNIHKELEVCLANFAQLKAKVESGK